MPIESVMPSNHLSLCHPLLNLSQHQGFFQWVSSLYQVAKVLEFQLQHQSFQWIVIDWFPSGWTGLSSLSWLFESGGQNIGWQDTIQFGSLKGRVVSGTSALLPRYNKGRAYAGEGPPGRVKMREAGKSQTTPLTAGTCTPTLPPDSNISHLGVSSTPGSGNWKDTAAQGHTVSKKLCPGLSQEQSDFKTHPPASALHSLHKEALKEVCGIAYEPRDLHIWIQWQSRWPACKEGRTERAFVPSKYSLLVNMKERVGL